MQIWKYTQCVNEKQDAKEMVNALKKIDSNIVTSVSKTPAEQYCIKISIQKVKFDLDYRNSVIRQIESVLKKYRDKLMFNEYKMPNLKETYNRLFGELPEEDRVGRSVSKPKAKQVINEAQMKSWLHLHKTFKTQYPGRSLAMTEGVIKLDGHIVESAETFLKRDLGSMVQVLKATHQKIKGLGQ